MHVTQSYLLHSDFQKQQPTISKLFYPSHQAMRINTTLMTISSKFYQDFISCETTRTQISNDQNLLNHIKPARPLEQGPKAWTAAAAIDSAHRGQSQPWRHTRQKNRTIRDRSSTATCRMTMVSFINHKIKVTSYHLQRL